MTNYTGSNAGPLNAAIATLDTTDLFLGGSSGNANAATKQLADNDAYLYKIMGGFEHILQVPVSGGTPHTLTVDNLTRNLIIMYQDTDNYFTGVLPQASTYPSGTLVVIKRLLITSIKPVTISCFAGDSFFDTYNISGITSIYLHASESITLYSVADGWQILRFEGNYYKVGDQLFGYTLKPGTLKRDGSLYNRADYPRLWAWVAANSLYTDDTTWASNPGSTLAPFPNKSMFSSGNGTTTFRVPDDRGLFVRALDLGAGVDADRSTASLGSTVASKEADAFKAHTHDFFTTDTSDTAGTGGGKMSTGNGTANGAFEDPTASTGGTETRPINVGMLPLVVY